MASAAANAAFCTELVLNIPGGNDDLENNIEEANVNVPTHERGMKSIARVLGTVGLFTLAMDVRTALYKPPSGVVFGEYKLAYYVILAVIFAFGVGEVLTAIWISWFSDTTRRLWIWGFVLFLSIWPFVGILSMSGLAGAPWVSSKCSARAPVKAMTGYLAGRTHAPYVMYAAALLGFSSSRQQPASTFVDLHGCA